MDYDALEPIIRYRASWIAKRPGVEWEDAYQEGWAFALATEIDCERNFQVRLKEHLIKRLWQDERRQKGIYHDGSQHKRFAYNPLMPRPVNVENQAHCRLIAEDIELHIMPIMTKQHAQLLRYCIFEADSDVTWQHEYALLQGVSRNTVNSAVKNMRSKVRFLYQELWKAKRSGKAPALKYRLPHGRGRFAQRRKGVRAGQLGPE